jgi:hypothetical protein
LQAGVRFLAGGGTIEKLRIQVLASGGYFQKRGGSTGAGFVRALYLDVLGSAADPRVVRALASQMTSAAARHHLIVQLMGQPAALRKVVQGLYDLAQLPLDAAAVDGYVTQLLHGTGEDSVLAEILSSQSYFASA